MFERYRQGEELSGAEVQALLPEREDFVSLWRYLKRETAERPMLEETPVRIARGAARATGQREALLRTLVCLDVMHERGLITLCSRADRLQITLNPVAEKVDLEDSHILRRLRQMQDQP